MNKIVTSVGLLALGASALHAAESSTLNSLQDTKAWSVQATLRGFYDDNANTVPSNTAPPNDPVDTFGFEVNPSVRFGMPGEQTSFNLGYQFYGRFYDKNPNPGRADKSDYTHTFDADLAHAFSPRFDVALSESFVIGQEPDRLQDPAGVQRIDGDNIRNFANIDFNLEATELLSFGFGYGNSLYDYDDDGNRNIGFFVADGTANPPSLSALLDRIEHNVRLDSFWKLTPKTVGILGYGFSQVNYTGDETILGFYGAGVMSDSRDNRIHTLSVGAQHVFTPTFSGSIRVGAQIFDQYGQSSAAVTTSDNTDVSPYVSSSLTYAFQEATSVDVGFSYSRQAANSAGNTGSDFVRDTQTATLYANLKHQLASKLVGTLNGTLSDSKYNGGGVFYDGKHQLYYRLGLDLAYEFTQNLSGHLGYNYDEVDSDLVGRSYDRNRIYMGVTAGF